MSDAVPVCIADNYKMLEEILPMEVIDHLEMYLQMGNQSTSEIAGISMMRAEACPNCNGGGYNRKNVFRGLSDIYQLSSWWNRNL